MGSIKESFAGKGNSSHFIPYISLGDPEYALSVEWAKALIDGGADILELGIPFSDPVADGPVIQKSYMRALSKGFCHLMQRIQIQSLKNLGLIKLILST